MLTGPRRAKPKEANRLLDNTSAPPQLISMSEIAELAGVLRPVVTTWRRRHADFPNPAAHDRGRPLFHGRQIVDWLVHTGRAERDQIEPDLRLHLLACLAAGANLNGQSRPARQQLPPRDLTVAITALICLRQLDDELLQPPAQAPRHVIADLRDRAARIDPDDRLLRTEINALPGDAGWLAAAVDELVEAAWGAPQAFERVLDARHRLNVPDLNPDAITPALARLIARLSGAREHTEEYGQIHIVDPMAGSGDLLMATRAEVDEDTHPSYAAAVTDPLLARILRRRLAVHGIPEADARIEIGTELPAGHTDPDVLVTHLPYRPKEERDNSDPLAAVRRIIERLTPGRTAVVLGPADLLVGTLPPYRAAVRTRNHLLDTGRVEAIVNLPGGLVPFRPGYRTALWVLRHETDTPGRGKVLLADVAHQELTDDLVETLVWDITTWRRDGHDPRVHLRSHATEVAIGDLITPRQPLTIRRPASLAELTSDPRQTIARVAELEAELAGSAQPTADRPPLRSNLGTRNTRARIATQPISALVRAGHLIMRKGYRIAVDHIGPDGHHPVLGRFELTDGNPPGARSVDRGVFADRYPRAQLTNPGDVVITLTPRLGVHLDRDGFAVVEFPARVLRVPPGDQPRFTPRVLAALLTAAAPPGRAASAVRPGVRLDELQLPLLSPTEAARLDALLAELDTRHEQAARQGELLDELRRVAVTGLTRGELTILAAPPHR